MRDFLSANDGNCLHGDVVLAVCSCTSLGWSILFLRQLRKDGRAYRPD